MPRSQSSGLNQVLWQQRHSERFARSLWRCCVELHTVDGGHATGGHLRGDVPDVDSGIIRKAQRCQLAVHVRNDLAHSSNNHGEAILPREAAAGSAGARSLTESVQLRWKLTVRSTVIEMLVSVAARHTGVAATKANRLRRSADRRPE